MAGYQGWFNSPTDGADRGWYHYRGKNGFQPGSTNIDFWPDVSAYKKTYDSRRNPTQQYWSGLYQLCR
ncbi:hypothetical protein [Sphingobacterium sp. Ag1]|uniref:hypothetical protein n=1 Tax=Sphingobacterium sp. Ag1 TaxID=1643451 RepID=UPI0018CFE8AA|nr:hypothetical protein [Sphingobacterium sp. Ag1]